MKIQTDKMLHVLASFALMEIFYSFSQEMLVAFALTLIVGLVKEFFDKKNTREEHIDDILANFAGITIYSAQFIAAEMFWNFKDF